MTASPPDRWPLPEVDLLDLRVHRVELDLVRPFATAHGTLHRRDVLLVHAVALDGEGWGECAALPTPSYSSEWVDGAAAVLADHLIPARLAGHPGAVVGHPMATAALDAALLDLQLTAAGTTLARWLGAERDRVDCGVAVGIAGTVDELLAEVSAHVEAGYQRVKLKVQPGRALEPVQAVRQAWPALAVGVDANGTLDARTLAALDHLGLDEIEQPLPAQDLVGLASAAARLSTPICLDESVASADQLHSALALGWRGHLNLKPGRVGGIGPAVAIHDLALAEGIPTWIGGMVATGVGKAVDVALAALPGITRPSELSPSSRWFATDLTAPWTMDPDGTIGVRPAGPVTLPGSR